MSRRNETYPTKVGEEHHALGQQFKHEAYGMIGASRVSGKTKLVGSELEHNHYIVVRVARTSKYRCHHQDRFFGSNQGMIELAMSEQQWATFVSSMNVGEGVPCTLERGPDENAKYKDYDRLAEESNHELAQQELRDYAAKITKELADSIIGLEKMIKDNTLSKPVVRERINELKMVMQGIRSNLPFHVEMHKEMMEKNVQAAKSDVEGYILNKVTALGLEALRKDAPALPDYTKKDSE